MGLIFEFLKYLSVTVVSASIDLLIFFILISYSALNIKICFVIAYLFAITISYIGNTKITFSKSIKQYIKKYIHQIIFITFFNFIFFLIIFYISKSEFISKIIQLCLSFIVNFLISKFYTYRS